MTYYETLQQGPMHNPQQQQWGYGLGQPAYGHQHGLHGGQPFIGAFGHNAAWGAQPQWWGQQHQQQPQWWGQQQPQGWGQQPQWGGQQRQLLPHEVNEVVRQLLPALPQILAQAQQPHAGLGYAAYGQMPRLLTQQDVNEVVRQILPIVPQIVGMLQGQPQLQYAALHGGSGGWGLGNLAAFQQPAFGQFGGPQFQAAFGVPQNWGQPYRPLSQQDVADVTRQLVGIIPQVIGNLQAFNQQRMI